MFFIEDKKIFHAVNIMYIFNIENFLKDKRSNLFMHRRIVKSPRYYIIGDVSATNILIGVYELRKDGPKLFMRKDFNGNEIENFYEQVLDDIFRVSQIKKENIEAMVLSPAGPILDGKVKMTNAKFSIDSEKTGVPTVLINDFVAIAYAVATLGLRGELESVRLPHSDGSYGKSISFENISIEGAGTGLGEISLHYDYEKKLYFPKPKGSEGGHKFLPCPDFFSDLETAIAFHLQTEYGGYIPHREALCSGRGIQKIFEFLKSINIWRTISEGKELSFDKTQIRDYYEANDKAAIISKLAKNSPNSIFGKTQKIFYRFYGRSGHDMIVHENAWAGHYIAGGAMRKDIFLNEDYKDKTLNSLVLDSYMEGLEEGPTHRDKVNNTPITLITDGEVGMKGALQVAITPEYMQREVHRKSV